MISASISPRYDVWPNRLPGSAPAMDGSRIGEVSQGIRNYFQSGGAATPIAVPCSAAGGSPSNLPLRGARGRLARCFL
jgi:hypothetical protein